MTPTVLLALATSLSFGGSDFLGGLASRRDDPFRVTATSQLLGGALLLVAAFVVPGAPATADTGWAVVAGICGGVGVVALYAAMAAGRMSIAAPLTAALAAAIPAAVDLALGTSVGTLAIAGIGLAIAAVVAVSISPGGRRDAVSWRPTAAVALAALAGLGFGGSLVAFARTAPASGLWPLVIARAASLAFVTVTALVRTRRMTAVPDARRAALGAGLLDAVANVTMIAALRLGPLAVAAVLSSLYPVVVVVLARVVLRERLRRVQQVGVAVALAAVLLIAAG